MIFGKIMPEVIMAVSAAFFFGAWQQSLWAAGFIWALLTFLILRDNL